MREGEEQARDEVRRKMNRGQGRGDVVARAGAGFLPKYPSYFLKNITILKKIWKKFTIFQL